MAQERGSRRVPLTLVADAADRLDVGERQVQRLARLNRLGKVRRPTKAEQAKYGLRPHTLVLDGAAVQRAKKARDRAMADSRIIADRKASARAKRVKLSRAAAKVRR